MLIVLLRHRSIDSGSGRTVVNRGGEVNSLVEVALNRGSVDEEAHADAPVGDGKGGRADPVHHGLRDDGAGDDDIGAAGVEARELPARGDSRWMVCATTSLPVPVSPSMITVAPVGAIFSITA